MLNVPESIKTLYKTDGVMKNFRVHFPNGEMEDITNEHIVRESLHFTESVCSQSVFRFGLAEASVIEFETVGVGNMFGMTIECSIEIDTTSLSSAEISAIQSGTWDGSLVLASASDIGFGFFRIPLGLFRVDKCPRNHGAMTHRQVTAYSVGLAENSITSSFERWKMSTIWPDSSLSYDLRILLDANLYANNSEAVAERYTRTAISSSTSQRVINPIQLDVDGGRIVFSFESPYKAAARAPQTPRLYLYAVDFGAFDNSSAIRFVSETLSSFGREQDIDSALLALNEMLYVQAIFLNTGEQGYKITHDEPIMYMPTLSPMIVSAPVSYTLTIEFQPTSGQSQSTSSLLEFGLGTLFSMYRLSRITPTQGNNVLISASGEMEKGTQKYYTYELSYNIPDLLRGWLELTGEFGTENRGRGFEQFALSPNNPVVINPGNYDEAWWDEYDVDAIGTVSLTFKSGDEEVTASVYLGNGSSVYDMTDNEALKMLDGLTLDGIVELLNGEFAQNAEEVGFTPTEITMQGWPWIEAGDALRITAEDGTVVNTYALRVEFSGIQNMMSDIISEGGEIVGEV